MGNKCLESQRRKVAKFTEASFVYVNDSWEQSLCYRTTIVVFKKKKHFFLSI